VPRDLGGNSGEELILTADPTSHLVPIGDALRLLQLHRRRATGRSPIPSVNCSDTRARWLHPAAGRRTGLANVLHAPNWRDSIDWRWYHSRLHRRAARPPERGRGAPILEEGSDGVRPMTVHKAKGLEFPVVILADLTCRLSRNDASRYLDASRGLCAVKIGGWAPHDLPSTKPGGGPRSGGRRSSGVAATRARDLLVVPALGDAWEAMAGLLNRVCPPLASRRAPTRGPKCPPFKSKDSVLERPDGEAAGPSTVCPGQHLFEAGGYSVVWWDPSTLSLGAKPPFGVRREELIVKDVPKPIVADGRGRYDRWQLARADARAAGSAPSLVVATTREWAARLAARSRGAAPGRAVEVCGPSEAGG
jgi:hypothetical protein